jgi:hypothetical protein
MRSDEAIMTAVTQTRSDAAALKKALMLIGGKWVESASGEVLEVEDPAQHRCIPRNDATDHAEWLAPRVAEDMLAQGDRLAFEFPAQAAEVADDVDGRLCNAETQVVKRRPI